MTLSPEKIETLITHLKYAMGTDHYHQTTMDVETATYLLQLVEKAEVKSRAAYREAPPETADGVPAIAGMKVWVVYAFSRKYKVFECVLEKGSAGLFAKFYYDDSPRTVWHGGCYAYHQNAEKACG